MLVFRGRSNNSGFDNASGGISVPKCLSDVWGQAVRAFKHSEYPPSNPSKHNYHPLNLVDILKTIYSKLITVFGATGLQGSSVLASLAANSQKPFTLRGITRTPSSAAAKKIADSGIHVVKADGWDKQSLISAFHGSWAVFANTNSDDVIFENPDEKRTEVDLGKIIVEAAAEAGVEILVYSGFNSASTITGGKIPVAAFDDKSAVWEYANSTGKFKIVVAVSPGWYIENSLGQDLAPILGGFPFVPAEDGTLVFRAPKWGGKEDVPFISIKDDYGDIVHGVLLEPEKWNGKLVQVDSDIKSFDQMAQAFENGTVHS